MIRGATIAARDDYRGRTGTVLASDGTTPPLARCLASPWAGAVLLAFICFVALFYGLGGYPLFDPDEGRSAEVAREMLVSGDWLVPTINFDQFFDKPAFYYWMIAGSIRLFGAHDYAVRLGRTRLDARACRSRACGRRATSEDRRGRWQR
jgi:hypothetical protein